MPNSNWIRASLAWFANRLSGQYRPAGEPRDDQAAKPSIYTLIKTQIAANPSLVELDDAQFPEIVGTTGRIKFAPGVMDALFARGSAEGKGWQDIKRVIDAINAGEMKDWQVVEERIAGIRTSPNIDKLLSELTIADVSDPVEDLFTQVALNSRNYEAVKWSIEIGGIRLSQPFADQLLVLARHPEFTPFVSFVLLRASDRHPEYKQYLAQLLPVSYQWGVITLIGYLVRDPSLIAQAAVQRDILIYGMEHNGGIPMEVGLTIARAIEMDHFFHEALENARTRAAIISLMNTLLSEPNPLGGILDLENGKGILEGYLEFLGKTFTDILTLDTLRQVERFLSDDQPPWADRLDKLHIVQAQFKKRFDINTGVWQLSRTRVRQTLSESHSEKSL